MDRVFADTNIILDWLGRREPYFEHARDLFLKAERKEIRVLLSTMSFISVEYILRKEIGREKALKALTAMRSIVEVCEAGAREIDLALFSGMRDFEAAVQYYTAKNNDAAVLITRNVKDFKGAGLPVMTAEAYLGL